MLVRASVAAAAMLFTGMTLYSVNLRQTYDEMYPADGLKREAFSICHQTDQTFIRAIRSDRIGCYDRMPNSFALAIGWVRRGAGLAAPPPTSFGTLETADLFLAGVARQEARAAARRESAGAAAASPACAKSASAPAAPPPSLAEIKLAPLDGRPVLEQIGATQPSRAPIAAATDRSGPIAALVGLPSDRQPNPLLQQPGSRLVNGMAGSTGVPQPERSSAPESGEAAGSPTPGAIATSCPSPA